MIICRHCRKEFRQMNPIQKFCKPCSKVRSLISMQESRAKHKSVEPNRNVIT